MSVGTDRWLSLVIIGFALLWWLPTRNLAGTGLDGSPGPGFFPRILLGCLLVLGLLLLGSTFLRRSKDQGEAAASEREGSVWKGLLMILLMAAYVTVLQYLGFLLATPPFLAVLLVWVTGRTRWRRAVVTALSVTGVIWLLFDVLLNAHLPAGKLF